MKKQWKNYEEVSVYLLNEFCEKFGLQRFEKKQKLSGLATEWEIDGKGVQSDGSVFIVVECRCYKTSKQSQEKIAALAYKINDLGAAGGIVVSPLGLQAGAKKIAEQSNIVSVKLSQNSTRSEYILSFLDCICIGVLESLNFSSTILLGGTIETKDH